MSDVQLADVLAALDSALTSVGARWYLFGAQAVALYGVPRLTADIDATIDAELDQLTNVVAALRDSGFRSRVPDLEGFVQRTRVLPFEHVETGVPADLVVAGPGLEEEFLSRARRMKLGAVDVPVIACEDLLVTKILAGRTKDLDDVRGVLRTQGDMLDLAHVRRLLGLLEQALDRSDLIDELEQARADATRGL